jgi:AcrR family transcriptional regulator
MVVELTFGLRERHKRRRKTAILDAVRAILREGREGDLTKDRIAERAEVAPATVYNLVGTRSALWEALADDFMEELARRAAQAGSTTDPVARIRKMVARTVEMFLEDPIVSKRMLHGWAESGTLLRRAPMTEIIAALEEARQAGVLRSDVPARLLAASISTGCLGAVHTWASGLLDDEKLHARARLAADVALAAAAEDAHRERLLRALRRKQKGS